MEIMSPASLDLHLTIFKRGYIIMKKLKCTMHLLGRIWYSKKNQGYTSILHIIRGCYASQGNYQCQRSRSQIIHYHWCI